MNRTPNILLWVLLLPFFSPTWSHGWECSVTVEGPHWVRVGETITLTAAGLPEGGQYHWSATPNLVPDGASATLTGFVPTFSEYIRVTLRYATPNGHSCRETKWVYVHAPCHVNLIGPTEAEPGEEVTLTAAGNPAGGTYKWSLSRSDGTLEGHDATALFIPHQPGEAQIEVTYTTPNGGKDCTAHHGILIAENCSVALYGALNIPLGQTVNLLAAGTPEGGIYQWMPLDGLIPGDVSSTAHTGSADYTPQRAGHHSVQAQYTTPGGQSCENTHALTAYKLESLSPRSACFDSGTALSQSDFHLRTLPEGHENTVTFMPPTITTLFQTQDVTVTGSCGESELNNATTTLLVVNKDQLREVSITMEIPNFVNDALKMIGVGEATDLRVNTSFTQFAECCRGEAVNHSTSGSAGIALHVDTGPFTIVGIPMPPKLKRYVTLDALAVGIAGQGQTSINGNHDGCADFTLWSGSGEITAGIDVGGEVKVVSPSEVIVFEGALKGSTRVSQEMKVESKQISISGNWDGLLVGGRIHIRILGGLKIKPEEISRNILKPKTIPIINVPLPDLSINQN